jgi:hypothetical protein
MCGKDSRADGIDGPGRVLGEKLGEVMRTALKKLSLPAHNKIELPIQAKLTNKECANHPTLEQNREEQFPIAKQGTIVSKEGSFFTMLQAKLRIWVRFMFAHGMRLGYPVCEFLHDNVMIPPEPGK